VARHLIPNSTQIPDIILDHWMARLSGAEFKVLLYIARRTYGFGKEKDRISLNQFAEGITKRDGSVLDRGTGISRSSVSRALNTLESMGIVLRQTNLAETGKEFDENTYSINLAWEPEGDSGGSPSSRGGGNGSHSSSAGVVAKSDYPSSKKSSAPKAKGVVPKSDYLVAKQQRGWSENETGVVPKSDPQETDQQETAATSSEEEGNAAADYQELVEKLTSNGVGRAVAEALAHSDPEACRRCLTYLPFADIRSSTGAFLANVIRPGYGPPKAYEEAQKRLARNRALKKGNGVAHAVDRPMTPPAKQDLHVSFLELPEKRPEEFAAFLVHEKEEQTKIVRFARRLSAKRRTEVLSGWQNADNRLDRYERWLQIRNNSPGEW
jgi:phage replication O-like protein O